MSIELCFNRGYISKEPPDFGNPKTAFAFCDGELIWGLEGEILNEIDRLKRLGCTTMFLNGTKVYAIWRNVWF